MSGTFSLRSFVASSPSIPGMRTSMITTSGLRRSASATALAPSEASPIDADVRRAREREPEPFADDLVVVDDQAGDLGLSVGVGVFGHGQRIVFRGSDPEGELLR